jgi:hypothetical protein
MVPPTMVCKNGHMMSQGKQEIPSGIHMGTAWKTDHLVKGKRENILEQKIRILNARGNKCDA